ncbi:MAG TPA: hypothetical protein VD770_03410, partial [Coxiellaceae bacterium]|nr:hypothetical protein [Coxiellaceae bacterium]
MRTPTENRTTLIKDSFGRFTHHSDYHRERILNELSDKVASSIDGVTGEEAVFEALTKPESAYFWTVFVDVDKAVLEALLNLLKNLTPEHQKKLVFHNINKPGETDKSRSSLLVWLGTVKRLYDEALGMACTVAELRLGTAKRLDDETPKPNTSLYLDYLKDLHKRDELTNEQIFTLLKNDSKVEIGTYEAEYYQLLTQCLAKDSGSATTIIECLHENFNKLQYKTNRRFYLGELEKDSLKAAIQLFTQLLERDVAGDQLALVATQLFEEYWRVCSVKEDFLALFVGFFVRLQEKKWVTSDAVLKIFATNPTALVNYVVQKTNKDRVWHGVTIVGPGEKRQYEERLSACTFVLNYMANTIKESGGKEIIRPLFTRKVRVDITSLSGDPVYENFSFFSFIKYVTSFQSTISEDGVAIFLKLIENNCLDDDLLSELSFCRNQIVAVVKKRLTAKIESLPSAALPETTASSEIPEPATSRVELELALGLASQDPRDGLGRYLLLAKGYKEPTASKDPWSDLGKLLLGAHHLEKILKDIRAGRFNLDQLKGLAFLKDDLCKYIISLSDANTRIEISIEALNKETPLGELFHLQRGIASARAGGGNLQKIRAQLQADVAPILTYLKENYLGSSSLRVLGEFRKEII